MVSSWKKLNLGDILKESRIPIEIEDINKRLTVKLHLHGVSKREPRATDQVTSTKYFERRAGQFIYGKQNLHNGAIGIVPDELDKFQSTQDVPAFDVSDEVETKWLYYYFSREDFYSNLERLSTGTGSKRVHPKELFKLTIKIPPLAEQKEIVEIISTLDKALEKSGKIIEQTEKIKKGLMQQLFTKGIGHTQFKKTEIGEIPEKWELVLLDEVATRRSGHTPNKKKEEYWNGIIPWISLKDSKYLDNRYVTETTDYTTEEGIANSSAVLLPKGTIVVSRDATVGKIGIMPKEMATSQHFINYICGNRLFNIYLYYDLIFRKKMFERIATGSTIKTIGLGFFKELKIALPPIEEQRNIANILFSIDDKIQKEKNYYEKLQDIKKGLMQVLLTGEIRVEVDEEEVITS
jgi:type I restriction enzyme, S subunit